MFEPSTNQRPVFFHFDFRFSISILFGHALRACLNEDDYLFSIRLIFFIQFNLHLTGRKVNIQAGIFKRIKFNKKSFWSFSFDFFVQFGKFVQLDVACPMKPKQTTQTCALSSIASEARSINLERQGHRSGRSPRPDGP